MGKTKEQAAEPLLAIDRKARELFKPHQDSAPIKALAWFGQAGDQAQLRVLSGGVIVLGLLRRDPRVTSAGVRMLVSHELATFAKRRVKHRVDRWRPNSADDAGQVKPRKGKSKAHAKSSFPSGHSAGAMAVASALAAELPEHRAAALAAGSAVSLAQVPTASHYPSDVAAGATIGLATDALVGLAQRALNHLLANRRQE